MERCSVLVVSYSAVCRTELSHIIAANVRLKLHAAVSTYDQAMRILELLTPDLVIVEIDIYPQQALDFIQQITRHHRNILAVYSQHTPYQEILTSLVNYGVREYLQLPENGLKEFFTDNRSMIAQRISDIANPALERKATIQRKHKLIAIGASMGGTSATEAILVKLQSPLPGIVIVQHMKEFMLPEYARRLNEVCPKTVKLAEDGERIETDHIYIAPGGSHTMVSRQGREYFIELRQGPPLGNHLPAVDVLFKSVADCAAADAMGIILTGMGEDGALGITQMYNKGALTIAQDEKSCAVFGMPRAAIMYGGIDRILSLVDIPEIISANTL